jgi:hypothetical protein
MIGLLKLAKYSLGVGDRFGRQAKPQLRACQLAARHGAEVIPVWNKSHREHTVIGSNPADTRIAADMAVKTLGWEKQYYVDADHIGLGSVGKFLPYADFYTLDVTGWIGRAAEPQAVKEFTDRHPELVGRIAVPSVSRAFETTRSQVEQTAGHYLLAVQQAGRIYRHIAQAKGEGRFITEVSMDETDSPQGPLGLLIILAALADEAVPVQTIAPRFSGLFLKGVDYVGDVGRFEEEFNADLAVIALARQQYNLPATLKLSMHSGSDKFSLYGPVRRALQAFDAGLHLKTAGTTWLEEVIGLAETGEDGLELAKEIYERALQCVDELCVPYAAVISIDRGKLPSAETVRRWDEGQFVAAVRHDPRNAAYNPHARQLLHVGYKVAAQMGERYFEALEACETQVARNVTANLFERHLKPLFVNGAGELP